MTQARIERQSATVARLARELRFELLLLVRMRARMAAHVPEQSMPPRMASLADVYAAALVRRAATEPD